jgi:hypothetical protein
MNREWAMHRVALAVFVALAGVSSASWAQGAAGPIDVPIKSVADNEDGDILTVPGGTPTAQAKAYSPFAGRNYPTRVLWGDTHLHTLNSGDAFTGGNRFTPEDAYRIARGAEVVSMSGVPAKLDRPLDFLVISDHSEGLGLMTEVYNGNPVLVADARLKRWSEMMRAGGEQARAATSEVIGAQSTGTLPEPITNPKVAGPLMMSAWKRAVTIADQYYEPGKFTTIVGFEWTPLPGGDNLHRNVLLRDGAGKADQMFPFTSWQSEDPEQLWAWMKTYEQKTGGRALAIPHNGNLSNGRMFAATTFSGAPLSREYAETRRRFEPLQEIVQIKGASESHPRLSTNDEFIGYGIEGWDTGNLTLSAPLTDAMMPTSYVRAGLMRGLEHEGKLGVNPFKFGVIGSTDVHNSLPLVREDNFFGKFVAQEPRADRWSAKSSLGGEKYRLSWQYLAAGFAAVWATENTREAVFDAMMRRETYATSGPRMTVRFFGGFDFTAADAEPQRMVDAGYTRGVPMGGDLRAAPQGKAPTFLVAALKDPMGANLDRIQIVKGWVDGTGVAQEKIYDVAWSGGRKTGPDGKVPAVGDTVDVATASYSNSIGAAELSAVWKDPGFQAGQRAFYYVRVLEIPTPRWTAYDQARFGVKMGPEVTMKVQERAWTSAIWYTPG